MTRHVRYRIIASCIALVLTASACGGGGGDASGEEDPAAFFEGETIEFVVPFDPGGGYDAYARLLAPHLEASTGATVVVKNEPGAGGLLATGKTAVSEPDGLRIQILNMPGAISAQIAGAEGAQFDLTEFGWVGRVAADPNVVVVADDSPFETFEEVMAVSEDEPFRFASTGPGANDYINAVVLRDVFGFPTKIISGFEGSEEAVTAVVRGDADAYVASLDSQLSLIQEGELRALLLLDEERSDEVPDTPTALELNDSDEGQEVLDQHNLLLEVGRAVGTGPGVPAEHIEFLQQAFEEAINDEGFLQSAKKQQRVVNFLPGAELETQVQELLEPPDAYREIIDGAF